VSRIDHKQSKYGVLQHW